MGICEKSIHSCLREMVCQYLPVTVPCVRIDLMIVRVAARYVVCRYNQRKAQTREYRHDRLSGSRDLHWFRRS
jgi:hypothetical protein